MDIEATPEQARPMAQQLGDLVRALSGLSDVTTDYTSVATALLALLGVSASSVVDTRSGESVVLVASPPEVSGLEASEHNGSGPPSLTAGRTNVASHMDDLGGLPAGSVAYAHAAAALGIRAVAALPLVADGQSFGALCLYSDAPRSWSEEDLDVGALLADLIAGNLGHTAAMRDQRLLTGQLQTALDSRVLVEQAKGVLAATENIGVDEAFARLRSQARRTNTRLDNVAAGVIAAGTGPR